MKKIKRRPQIVFISTYPPRGCGIATFTKDLTTAFNKENPEMTTRIVAMDNENTKNNTYPREVILRIKESDTKDYEKAAKIINKNDAIKGVSIQHEFGLYGGKFLNYLPAFFETINKPVITTFHTVIPNPPENIKSFIRYIAKMSDAVVVMTNTAVDILKKDYGIPSKNIAVIPHGIHEIPYKPSSIAKRKLQLKDRLVLLSFGLITGGKSYEDIIEAMPGVIKKYPNVLYIIAGQTHPGVLEKEGEKYRNRLKSLIKKLKLQNHVQFVNKYLSLKEILSYLQACDIFVSSGKGINQIVSGTLSYALGAGRPIVSIPFLHAKEAVTKDRGILTKVGNPKSFERAILKLLSDDKLRERMGQNAYDYSRSMLWSNVAKLYAKEFKKYF